VDDLLLLEDQLIQPVIKPSLTTHKEIGIETSDKSLYELFLDWTREVFSVNISNNSKVDKWIKNLDTSDQINPSDDVLHLSAIEPITTTDIISNKTYSTSTSNNTDAENELTAIEKYNDELLRSAFEKGCKRSFDQFDGYFDDFIVESSLEINSVNDVAEVISTIIN
jgi:hypothetical protein